MTIKPVSIKRPKYTDRVFQISALATFILQSNDCSTFILQSNDYNNNNKVRDILLKLTVNTCTFQNITDDVIGKV